MWSELDLVIEPGSTTARAAHAGPGELARRAPSSRPVWFYDALYTEKLENMYKDVLTRALKGCPRRRRLRLAVWLFFLP